MSVKVAVRVRPFNARESEMGCKLVIDMKGQTTLLYDQAGKPREFSFDYSFWSHDDFEIDENGYSQPTTSRYSDQMAVFNTVGKEILDNSWQGYHCCLFAYGQTGSGKSYSMMGYGANKGIVPVMCEEIFERVKSETNPNKSYEICFSMIEIYNEKVQDLLIDCSARPAGGLKVREHKILGVFVDGLSKHPVDSFQAIEEKMEIGNHNRTIGSTLMNATSSRAHTVIQIEFRQLEKVDGRKTEKLSVINLVDLAGSEKLSKTEATGDRMKEGCAINKSLSTLGLVISKLADKAMGVKNVIIPYRDSSLTRILQNALGGNSKTLMICAISPADNNYDETLSTLRYADQAKKIKLNAVINESEQDKMIRDLKSENQKLKELLQQLSLQGLGGSESQKLLFDIKEQLEVNNALSQQIGYQEQYQSKLQHQKEQDMFTGNKLDESQPFLMNLNEDPLLTGKIKYGLSEHQTIIGKKDGNPIPQIILGGIGIKPNHAIITNEDEQIFLEPYDNECGDYLFINGEHCREKTELRHNDRIIIGTGSIFLIKIPFEEINHSQTQKEHDWEYANNERMKKVNQFKQEEEAQRQQEMEQQKKLIEEKFLQEKLAYEQEMQRKMQEYDEKLKELEKRKTSTVDEGQINKLRKEEQDMLEYKAKIDAEQKQKIDENQKKLTEIQDAENWQRFKFQQKNYLENKFAKYLPKVLEINLIAKELKRNVSLQATLSHTYSTDNDVKSDDKNKKLKIQIQVFNREEGTVYLWDVKKFQNRYYIIKEILDRYLETNQLPHLKLEEDPFWDPPEPHLIGQSFLKLMSLAYLLDNPSTLTVMRDEGPSGNLEVDLYPTDPEGVTNIAAQLEEQQQYFEPQDLIGNNLYYKVQIRKAVLLKENWKNIYCEYKVINEQHKIETFKTPYIEGLKNEVTFDYERVHCIKDVDQDHINYLLENNICFNIYGNEQLQPIKQQMNEIKQLEDSMQMNIKQQGNNNIFNNNQQQIDNEHEQELLKRVSIRQTYDNQKLHKQIQQNQEDAKKGDKKQDKNGKDCTIF